MPKAKKPSTAKQLKELQSGPIKPWIPMKNGIIVISITSVAMAVLTAFQVAPVKGWLEGILWGLLFGGMIWVIFFGMILLNRFLKR